MEPIKPAAIQPGATNTGQWASQGPDGLKMAGGMGQPAPRSTHTVTLSNGMKLTIQEPSASDMYRMAKVLAGVPPTDMRWNYAMALFCITSVNDQPFRKPQSEPEMELFLDRLGPAHMLTEFLEELGPIAEGYRTPKQDVLKNS